MRNKWSVEIEKEVANLLVDDVVDWGVAVEPVLVVAVLVEPLVEPVVEVVYSKEERNCKGGLSEVQHLINQHTRKETAIS